MSGSTRARLPRRFTGLRAWAAAGCLCLALSACQEGRHPPRGEVGRSGKAGPGEGAGAVPALNLTDLLGDAAGGFEKVRAPRPFAFPPDHGPHPGSRNEWWYFTGNLRDTLGRAYGYQLTFFRSGLVPPAAAAPRASPWAARDAYMAHFTLTEAAAGRFQAHERFSRGALGLAGAQAGSPGGGFRVWVEDWYAASQGADGRRADSAFFPLRLRAAQGTAALDLVLGSGKPMVLQGDKGYSDKDPLPKEGQEAGSASYYYSFTRLPSRGTLKTAEGTFAVTGESWMDREWGSSTLAPGLSGWDWFGLRLEDSTEYLFFRIRPEDQKAMAGPLSFQYGLAVDSKGQARVLPRPDLGAEILSTWRSPRGRTYPARWRIDIPSESLSLEIMPWIADQELDLSVPYWEGAVGIKARRGGREITGQGYMELTGY